MICLILKMAKIWCKTCNQSYTKLWSFSLRENVFMLMETEELTYNTGNRCGEHACCWPRELRCVCTHSPCNTAKEFCNHTLVSFHRTDASKTFGMSECRKPLSSTLSRSEHVPWKNEAYSAEPGHYITFSKTAIHLSVSFSTIILEV